MAKLVELMYNQEEDQGDSSVESSLNEFLDVVDAPRARYTVPYQRHTNLPTTSVLSVLLRKISSSKRRRSSSIAIAKDFKERAIREIKTEFTETQLSNINV